MKILLSILFYCTMAGTTATVGSHIDDFAVNTNESSGVFKAFGVAQKGKTVAVTWAAAADDITHFIVERSADGQCFKPVITMNYNNANAFKYIDGQTPPSLVHYRIAAVKKAGLVEYSKTKKLRGAGS
ncbi:MAG TPA: hypothetical protein VEY06_09075 [Flavisolibacter sp.]|nr:hypothetical protein [Flavisolibacter sp.]